MSQKLIVRPGHFTEYKGHLVYIEGQVVVEDLNNPDADLKFFPEVKDAQEYLDNLNES